MPIPAPTRLAAGTEPDKAALTLALPWYVLVRDNARHGLMRGRIVLTEEYREALVTARILVQHATRGREPMAGRVALVATFHEPDRSRRRDVTNYAKLLCDALSHRALVDDSQIDDARYVRGAVDKTNPRVEVTLTPMEGT